MAAPPRGNTGYSVYLLHEFVLMPDHFHLLISPTNDPSNSSREDSPTGQEKN
jgi:REP element-mobilizing transposase RayT